MIETPNIRPSANQSSRGFLASEKLGGAVFLLSYVVLYLAFNVPSTLSMYKAWSAANPGESWASNLGRFTPNSAVMLLPIFALAYLFGRFIARFMGKPPLAKLGLISLISITQVIILEAWSYTWMFLRAVNFNISKSPNHVIGRLVSGFIILWLLNLVLSSFIQWRLLRRPNPPLNSDPA